MIADYPDRFPDTVCAVTTSAASLNDIRLCGMMLDALKKAWAGRLGGGPQPHSPLDLDLRSSSAFATSKLSRPFTQSWAFAGALGNVATNHEHVLGDALLDWANGQSSDPVKQMAKPVSVVSTMTRVVFETLALQAWLIDPSMSTQERFTRWMALQYESELAAWRIIQPGGSRLDNPQARELVDDAQALGLDVDSNAQPRWIGTKPPTSTNMAELLLQRYGRYAGSLGDTTTRMGESALRGSRCVPTI